ncbi:MAG TPA: permease [Anaerolineaceae bacterium]|nr:permease [Anaerolineaceae bacterium]
MEIGAFLIKLVQGGFGSLASYLAAHVLLCLLPAFFIAGGMSALIPRESIMRFLGRKAPKYISYPAAAAAGSLLAVCSCTIVPLFAGIYKKGAGLGPAITFLFFAPAANILALAYTGVAIGADLAFARLFLSLAFGIGIGMIMALIFRREDAARESKADDAFSQHGGMRRGHTLFLLVMVALLISGTLKLDFLTNSYAQFTLPIKGMDTLQNTLYTLIPFDAAKGEEGVSAQGLFLIILLLLLAFFAWKGFEKIHSGANFWTWGAFGILAFTLLAASTKMLPHAGGMDVQLTGRTVAVAFFMLILGIMAGKSFNREERTDWIWESWRFIKQIFPLLIVGVFAVGLIRQIIKPEWIEFLAGRNTIAGNLAGVVFGVFMYFPTLVEVPIAKMFLNLGMHRGPLLAYLMADPELSLQSILITATIIGKTKAWTYVGWVALFSTLAGLIYGAWSDGAAIWKIGGYILLLLSVLAVILWRVSRKQNKIASPQ